MAEIGAKNGQLFPSNVPGFPPSLQLTPQSIEKRERQRRGFSLDFLPICQIGFGKASLDEIEFSGPSRKSREGLIVVEIIMNKQLPRLRRGLDIFPSPVSDRPGL